MTYEVAIKSVIGTKAKPKQTDSYDNEFLLNVCTAKEVQRDLLPLVKLLPSHDDNQFGSVALDDIIINVGAFYGEFTWVPG